MFGSKEQESSQGEAGKGEPKERISMLDSVNPGKQEIHHDLTDLKLWQETQCFS